MKKIINATQSIKSYICAILLSTILLAACSGDDNKSGSGQLRFKISQESMINTTRSVIGEVIDREEIILTDGTTLEITLQEDVEQEATTRSEALTPGTYAILGYNAADDAFVGKTVGTVNSLGIFVSDDYKFPTNYTYNFVCVANADAIDEDNKTATVSCNCANRPTISYTETNQTLTANTDKEIAFTMKHTESRLRVKLQGNDFSDVKAYLLSTSDNHPQSAVWNIYKNNFSNYPTDESVASAAITTTDYTFSFPVSSGSNLVSEYKYLLPGTIGGDLLLNLEGKISDVEYNGSIKLKNLGILDRNKSYLVTAAVKINSGSGDILYFDTTVGDEARIKIGRWPTNVSSQNDLAFFKFGSVIGFRFNNDGWLASMSQVVYNPSSYTIGQGNSNDIYRYNGLELPGIPCWVEGDWDAYNSADAWDKFSYCVSGDNYHTIDNIKKGKGDPCKLANLSVAEVKAALAANEVPDNKTWRLPTNAEQKAYVKGTTTATGSTFNSATWAFWSTQLWNGNSEYGYATYPFTGSTLNAQGTQLPAAGFREGTGAADNRTTGNYWTNTPQRKDAGYYLFFENTRTLLNEVRGFARGLAIRCVRQNP